MLSPARREEQRRRQQETSKPYDTHRPTARVPKELPAGAMKGCAQRLAERHQSVYLLGQWITSTLDPSRTGMLTIGEFMCLWMQGKHVERKRIGYATAAPSALGSLLPYVHETSATLRPHAEYADMPVSGTGLYFLQILDSIGEAGKPGPAPPQTHNTTLASTMSSTASTTSSAPSRKGKNFSTVEKLAAVSSLICARIVQRERDLEAVDVRTAEEQKREHLWYGDHASWREQDGDLLGRELPPELDFAEGGGFAFTHNLLVRLRYIFEGFQDADGGIRYGKISAFFLSINHDKVLGRALHFTSQDMNDALDSIVSHVEGIIPVGPWVEPSISFNILLGLVVKLSAAPAQRAEAIAFFNEGMLVFDSLASHEPSEGFVSVRSVLASLASAAPELFSDTVNCNDILAAVHCTTPLRAW